MKNLIKICLFVVSMATFAQNSTIDEKSSEKKALSMIVDEMVASGELNKEAVIVLNGAVVAKKDLSDLLFHSTEILTMNVFGKGNKIMTDLYGEESANGVLLIQTTPRKIKLASDSNNKVLYLIDNKIVTEASVHALNPNMIESINVLKGKKDVARYTTKDYDGVILITLK